MELKLFEIRNLSDSEIQGKMEEAYKELFNLRFRHSIGQVKDTSSLKKLKRNVAQMKTVLNERVLAVS